MTGSIVGIVLIAGALLLLIGWGVAIFWAVSRQSGGAMVAVVVLPIVACLGLGTLFGAALLLVRSSPGPVASMGGGGSVSEGISGAAWEAGLSNPDSWTYHAFEESGEKVTAETDGPAELLPRWIEAIEQRDGLEVVSFTSKPPEYPGGPARLEVTVRSAAPVGETIDPRPAVEVPAPAPAPELTPEREEQ